jgi:hypothetical protein
MNLGDGGALMEEKESIPDGLKGEINTLLWASLPSAVTLGEAEQMAVQIHELIAACWEKVRR